MSGRHRERNIRRRRFGNTPASLDQPGRFQRQGQGPFVWAAWWVVVSLLLPVGSPVPALAWVQLDPAPVVSLPAGALAPALPDDGESDEPTRLLRAGITLERRRAWDEAVRHYTEASKRHPDCADFQDRKRLCEIHARLNKRYRDRSFQNDLLTLEPEVSQALYAEVLEQIERHYVDVVSMERLVKRGIDHFDVALRDPVFVDRHLGHQPAERIRLVRERLRAERQTVRVSTRREAIFEAHRLVSMASRALRLEPTPAMLEFIFGACDALDPHTTCLTPDRLNELFALIDGNFVGLGVDLKYEQDALKLVGVLRGGPAAEAGLRPGDWIIAVDGRSLAKLDLDTAARTLEGPEGSSVELEIRRAPGTIHRVRLVRRHVEIESVAEVKIIDRSRGVGYIRLNGFQRTTLEEFQRAMRRLEQDGMTALVLDLRDNPGGLLNVSIDLADLFLDRGRIVRTRGRAADQTSDYIDRTPAVYRLPLAVLIDRHSASAAEVLAGALKENERALVVGETSYGKGSIQSILPLRTVPVGLKLTTAVFHSPLDHPYSGHGVVPNLMVRSNLKPTLSGESAGAADGTPAYDPIREAALRRLDDYPKLGPRPGRAIRTQPGL
ncbi:carboxyl-terminal protease [Isosphaera pallida ATCC 43644]|uniref:Carboxyl-terminal protease n=1 Tax=Isosphaera pallida (strain ATCC 43644 / DSM 9630 / IS1B) TaxID=575540 RepID=E8R4S1_ISOPI|nr:S41 family peptidase [Isosphaera pallida]ADV61667.1 carboxyl-terminal protease [Isosphaera pallida ATCC 43644]